NVLQMARPELKNELAAAIRQAGIHKQQTVRRGLQVDCNGEKLLLNLTVKPIPEQAAMRGLMMVIFEEAATPIKTDKSGSKPTGAKRTGKSIMDLEQELQHSKEDLQTTIEEFET